MTTYRTGNHWGVTIVREAPASHSIIEPAQLVAVVVNGDQALAERICALLNADQRRERSGTGNPGCGWCVAEGCACPVHEEAPSGPPSATVGVQQDGAKGSGGMGGAQTLSEPCSLHTGWADKDGRWVECSPDCLGNQPTLRHGDGI